MKPVILIWTPLAIWDEHQDQLRDTATWRRYQGRFGPYMACAIYGKEHLPQRGALDVTQIEHVCGGLTGNSAVMFQETTAEDYAHDLRMYGLVPEGVEVTPE